LIECIFTLDYEIYGDGTGGLKDLVYEPGKQLREIFQKWNVPLVAFVEVAELEQIERTGTDSCIHLVKQQIRQFYEDGFEIALHLHPQWYNAVYTQGRWVLDQSEYNLCTLSRRRICEIADRAIEYLRYAVGSSEFTPLSFRAGNWLFQPSAIAAGVLAERGIRIDSSVFKGGIQRDHGLDYRAALNNGYYWSFGEDVVRPDPAGHWTEFPIYTEMVAPWRMTTKKRLAFGNKFGVSGTSARRRWNRIRDFVRSSYPLKLDFCRMTGHELRRVMSHVTRHDRESPHVYRPIVAIGHTKDLVDLCTIDDFLRFLSNDGIPVRTLTSVESCARQGRHGVALR
jgi:hypothetical protein